MKATSPSLPKRVLKSSSSARKKHKRSSTLWMTWPGAMTSRPAWCVGSEVPKRYQWEFMKSLQHAFGANGMISILYWRICHEVIQAAFDPTALLFACAIHCASRFLWSHEPIQRTVTNSAGATVTARVAATGRADRLIPRCFGRTDPRSLDLSNADCRGRPLAAESFRP